MEAHLYILVAAPFVAELIRAPSPADPGVGRVQRLHPGGVPGRVGGRGSALRPGRGSARTQPHPEPDHPPLRRVYGPFGPLPDVVAPADPPLPGGPGHRRRVGGRGGAGHRDLAATLAGLDQPGPDDRLRVRHAPGDARGIHAAREPPGRLRRRRAARPAGLLAPPRPARARRVACGQGRSATGTPRARRPVPTSAPPHDGPDAPALLAGADDLVAGPVLDRAISPHFAGPPHRGRRPRRADISAPRRPWGSWRPSPATSSPPGWPTGSATARRWP